jgi:hypothetical protein
MLLACDFWAFHAAAPRSLRTTGKPGDLEVSLLRREIGDGYLFNGLKWAHPFRFELKTR